MGNGKVVQIPFGIFGGVLSETFYEDGSISGLRLGEKNVILTHAGALTPFYGEETARRKYKPSVTFHKNGMLKAVSLQDLQEVQTPIGEFPAELVTFYETGELHRVFLLDGQLSGYWSEEEERALNFPLRFEFDFGAFSAMLSGICFYRSGGIKSLTFFPGQVVVLEAPGVGAIQVKNGISLFESGKLQSLEPAEPMRISTPIGTFTAFDPLAVGVNADSNSLRFSEARQIINLTTAENSVLVVPKTGVAQVFAPLLTADPEDGETKIGLPLSVAFSQSDSLVTFTRSDGLSGRFHFEDKFVVTRINASLSGCADCSSCDLCRG